MTNEQRNEKTSDKERAAAGGHSEQQVKERNAEQAKTDHDESAEVPRGPAQNVKSEPHWDPTEKPAKGRD